MSKGNHEVKTISWFDTMRDADWMMWTKTVNPAEYLVRRWMIGMYPAFVKYPVSGSLVGSSSHVKESVRLSRCSMSRLQ
jgi:hypothetical protein